MTRTPRGLLDLLMTCISWRILFWRYMMYFSFMAWWLMPKEGPSSCLYMASSVGNGNAAKFTKQWKEAFYMLVPHSFNLRYRFMIPWFIWALGLLMRSLKCRLCSTGFKLPKGPGCGWLRYFTATGTWGSSSGSKCIWPVCALVLFMELLLWASHQLAWTAYAISSKSTFVARFPIHITRESTDWFTVCMPAHSGAGWSPTADPEGPML